MDNKDTLFVGAVDDFKKKMKLIGLTPVNPYETAIELAYKDLQWRTVPKHSNQNKGNNIISIAQLFEKSVSSKTPHSDLIKAVEQVFVKDGVPSDQSFGKAQKVVNMGLKYLYCLSGSSSADFVKRDMPLDDYILDYYYSKIKAGTKSKNRISNWSKITPNEYNDIQNDIKKFISDNKWNLSPIEAEFLFWDYERVKKAKNDSDRAMARYNKLTKNQIDVFKTI